MKLLPAFFSVPARSTPLLLAHICFHILLFVPKLFRCLQPPFLACFAQDLLHVRDHPDEAIRNEMLDGRTGVGSGRHKTVTSALVPEAKVVKSRSIRAKEQGEVLSI